MKSHSTDLRYARPPGCLSSDPVVNASHCLDGGLADLLVDGVDVVDETLPSRTQSRAETAAACQQRPILISRRRGGFRYTAGRRGFRKLWAVMPWPRPQTPREKGVCNISPSGNSLAMTVMIITRLCSFSPHMGETQC